MRHRMPISCHSVPAAITALETGNQLIQGNFNTKFERQSNIILVFRAAGVTLAVSPG